MLRFGNHRLDLADQRLWRGEIPVPLGPKAFAVLRHLVERAGRLVTKGELLGHVWADTHVGEAVLKTCILEIRKALGDDPRRPRFIETLHRRGYRFLPHPSDDGASPAPVAGLCGRREAMAELDAALARATEGTRQVVFVTGDAGIGKTTLVDAFLVRVAADPAVWVARGQCLEVFGAEEPYRPVIDAFGRLCREPDRERLVDLLREHAPTWLVQMPALLDAEQRATLQREVHGLGADRMPRELADLLELLTAHGTLLVLVVEDLHWSDTATLDLLTLLARRRDPARLLVVATYRPVDAAVREHPLRAVHHELAAHRLAHEIPLDFLGEADVTQYLAHAVPGAESPELARRLRARTDGLPLFLAAVIDELIAEQRIARDGDRWRLTVPLADVEIGIPDGIRRLIEKQIEHLDIADRELLLTGSLAGDPFSATLVARALERDTLSTEERCEALMKRSGILRAAGVEDTPGGEMAARFAFRHALYRRVLYDAVPDARRVRLCRRLGELLEQAWGGRATEIAAELATHFETGRDWARGVRYRRLAAEHATGRGVYADAFAHLDRADALLRLVDDPVARDEAALAVLMTRAPALAVARGYGAPEVGDAFTRAHELCRHLPDTPHLLPSLWGLLAFHCVRGDLRTARRLVTQCDTIAGRAADDGLRLEAHHAAWTTLCFAGDLVDAEAHADAGISLYDVRRHADHVLHYAQDPGVSAHAYRSLVVAVRGRLDEGLRAATASCTFADRIGHLPSRAFARMFLALTHMLREEPSAQRAVADEGLTLATAHEFAYWAASLTIFRGQALARGHSPEKGLALMARGITALRATGAELAVPCYLTTLADEQARHGRLDDAERTLGEASALAEETGQELWRAETFRVAGDVAASRGEPRRAESAYRSALDVARRQRAGLFELRAAVALATALRDRRRLADARTVLIPPVRRMREGRELSMLATARALLRELGAR